MAAVLKFQNDGTNNFKDLPEVFKGATNTSGANPGLVPAIGLGQQNTFLCGDGTWSVIPANAVQDLTVNSGTGTGSTEQINTTLFNGKDEATYATEFTFTSAEITSIVGVD